MDGYFSVLYTKPNKLTADNCNWRGTQSAGSENAPPDVKPRKIFARTASKAEGAGYSIATVKPY